MFEVNVLIVVLNSSTLNSVHHSITQTIPIKIIIHNSNNILTGAVVAFYLLFPYNSQL